MMKVVIVEAGFYWVKYRPGGRWEPAEYDGEAWMVGDGSGRDLYMIGPRIREPPLIVA
jgi:hypothetical protein